MSKREAIARSLKKWARIVDGDDEVNPWGRCALCDAYRGTNRDCHYCPISEYNRSWECEKATSPWSDTVDQFPAFGPLPADYIPACMAMYLALLMVRDA